MGLLSTQKPDELRKLHLMLELSGMAMILYTIVIQVVLMKDSEKLEAKGQSLYQEHMAIYIENQLYRSERNQADHKMDLINLNLKLMDMDRAIQRIDTISRLCSEVFVSNTRDEEGLAMYRCKKAREFAETLLKDPDKPAQVKYEEKPLLDIQRPERPHFDNAGHLSDIIWAIFYGLGTGLLMWAKYIERVHFPRLKDREDTPPA